jgi:hypothetical protein
MQNVVREKNVCHPLRVFKVTRTKEELSHQNLFCIFLYTTDRKKISHRFK